MYIENGLFIFRRDLRIIDNNGLNYLSTLCKNIYTIFIFTPEQVGNGNDYKSDNSVQFMIESLEDLSNELKKKGGQLYTFYGKNNKVITNCIKAYNIDVVGFNLDITPYSRLRDKDIIELCEKMKIYVTYDHDYYLHNPGTILNGSGEIYQKFTPYYNNASKIKVTKPVRKNISFGSKNTSVSGKITLTEAMNKFTKENENILVHGGRENAIKQMTIAKKNVQNYDKTRNNLTKSTSQLSAYIKFGCVSIREVYHTFQSNKDFLRQLYWRDFYAGILFEFPHTLNKALKPKYDKIQWKYNKSWFDKWCEGKTGFPIVDAGMRELNVSGYMHNRSRLIVSSFLIKTLLISWQKGSQYFSQKLTDYDPASNQLNWQWTASSGPDSQPFFRIFNPWLQQKEHDPNCEYIKKWIPELKDVPTKDIHNWETTWKEYKDSKYPKPVVDYSEQKEKALAMYKKALY